MFKFVMTTLFLSILLIAKESSAEIHSGDLIALDKPPYASETPYLKVRSIHNLENKKIITFIRILEHPETSITNGLRTETTYKAFCNMKADDRNQLYMIEDTNFLIIGREYKLINREKYSNRLVSVEYQGPSGFDVICNKARN